MTEKFTLSSLHQLQHQRARAGLPLHVQLVNRDAGTQPNGSISYGVLINARTGYTPGGSAGGATHEAPSEGATKPLEAVSPESNLIPPPTPSRPGAGKTHGTAVPLAGTARVMEAATTGPASPEGLRQG